MKQLSYRIWVLIFGIAVAAVIATVLFMSDGGKSGISRGKNIIGKEGKTAGWFVIKKVTKALRLKP
ncbi:hypothetical protein BH09BAC3_BH09BAC3_08260 [soil metagenome]